MKSEFAAEPQALAPLLTPAKNWYWLSLFALIAGLHLTTVSREMGGLLGGKRCRQDAGVTFQTHFYSAGPP